MTRILLIEPDHVLSEIYARALLQHRKASVRQVQSAQQAIAAADTKAPDLIILELQLVEHSGIEFLYELRSYPEWQAIPVIIQSLVPFGEFRDNWDLLHDELGVVQYLYKPHTSLQKLLATVNELSPITA